MLSFKNQSNLPIWTILRNWNKTEEFAEFKFVVFVRNKITMAAVVKKFFIASMFMWMTPLAILYAFNHNLLPGKIELFFFRFFLKHLFWSLVAYARISSLRLIKNYGFYCGYYLNCLCVKCFSFLFLGWWKWGLNRGNKYSLLWKPFSFCFVINW